MTTEPTPTTTDDSSRREEARAKIEQAIQNIKAELSTRLDQLLDELGAMI
jgi:hypothetical protein